MLIALAFKFLIINFKCPLSNFVVLSLSLWAGSLCFFRADSFSLFFVSLFLSCALFDLFPLFLPPLSPPLYFSLSPFLFLSLTLSFSFTHPLYSSLSPSIFLSLSHPLFFSLSPSLFLSLCFFFYSGFMHIREKAKAALA